MNVVRVNVALDAESKELLHEEARRHRLSLSAWLRVLAQIMKLPAPADMPMSLLRSQVAAIIEEERLRKKG